MMRGRLFGSVIFGFVMSVCSWGTLFAAENVSTEAKIVGETFKAMARAYVASADMTQLKDKGVHRIESMKEAQFKKKYSEVYKVVRELPSKIRAREGITPEMTRAQAIRFVRTLDKKRLYEMIDNMPDAVIAQEFYERTARKSDARGGGDILSRISRAWGTLVMKINKSPASGK